jgi:hypothetical protein
MTEDEKPMNVIVDQVDEMARDADAERRYWEACADGYGRALVELGFHTTGTHQGPNEYDFESWRPCDRMECVRAFTDRLGMFMARAVSAVDEWRKDATCVSCGMTGPHYHVGK